LNECRGRKLSRRGAKRCRRRGRDSGECWRGQGSRAGHLRDVVISVRRDYGPCAAKYRGDGDRRQRSLHEGSRGKLRGVGASGRGWGSGDSREGRGGQRRSARNLRYRVVSSLGDNSAITTEDGIDNAASACGIVEKNIGDRDRGRGARAGVVREGHVVAIVRGVEGELTVRVRGEGVGEKGDAVVGVDGRESAGAVEVDGNGAERVGAFDDGGGTEAGGDYGYVALLREI